LCHLERNLEEHKKYTVSLEETPTDSEWLAAPLPLVGNIVTLQRLSTAAPEKKSPDASFSVNGVVC
jgi:hypothetical protein